MPFSLNEKKLTTKTRRHEEISRKGDPKISESRPCDQVRLRFGDLVSPPTPERTELEKIEH
jgi:hypothetical protein